MAQRLYLPTHPTEVQLFTNQYPSVAPLLAPSLVDTKGVSVATFELSKMDARYHRPHPPGPLEELTQSGTGRPGQLHSLQAWHCSPGKLHGVAR